MTQPPETCTTSNTPAKKDGEALSEMLGAAVRAIETARAAYPIQATPDRDETANVALANAFAIFSIEEDENYIRLSTFGQQVACWPANSPQGIALLKLDAERRATPTLPADVKGEEPWNEPPLTCPHIDAAIASGELSDAVKAELDTVRGINSQLRHGTWALRAEITSQTAEIDRLNKKISSACRWYWPEDDTSSEACAENPREALEQLPPGKVAAYSCGGVIYINYYGWLPPADDADSDDDFEVDEPTLAAAEAKIQAELDRRAASRLIADVGGVS